MARRPTAAIIIPVYNAAQTLDRSIESAVTSLRQYTDVEQQPLDAEIVVVDDVSTDGSADIARAWSKRDPAVRLVTYPTKSGPGFARNEGVRQAVGNFLFFLDSDDVFYPNHISACLNALLADDAVGYVFTRMKIDMPMHPDWPPSLDESCPINFCVRRVWHEMILGFAEEPDFRTYRTEDTLYRLCLRDLVKHKKLNGFICEQFVSPGNALDRQRTKFGMSMKDWNTSGLEDGFVLTPQMDAVVKARLDRVAKLLGAKI